MYIVRTTKDVKVGIVASRLMVMTYDHCLLTRWGALLFAYLLNLDGRKTAIYKVIGL